MLARAPAWPLVGHGAAFDEHLAAPDSPWLPALDGAGEAGGAQWAWTTEGVGLLQLTGGLGGGQPRSRGHAWQRPPGGRQEIKPLHVGCSLCQDWCKQKGRGGRPRPSRYLPERFGRSGGGPLPGCLPVLLGREGRVGAVLRTEVVTPNNAHLVTATAGEDAHGRLRAHVTQGPDTDPPRAHVAVARHQLAHLLELAAPAGGGSGRGRG